MPTLSSIKPLTVAKTLSKDSLHTMNMDPSNAFLADRPAPEPAPVGPITGAVNTVKAGAKNIIKDAAQTLLVKPAARIGQVIAAPFTQNKVDTTTDIQNQQTDQIQRTLDLMKTETDPIKFEALKQMTKKLVAEATQNSGEGEQAIRQAGNLDQPANISVPGAGTYNIPAQQGGAAGAKQIAGDALKSASYLASPEALGTAGKVTGVLGKIGAGAAEGTAIGAASGAGNELENPNSTAGSVLKSTGKGALVGAAIGAGTGAINSIVSSFKPNASQAPEQTALDAIKNPLTTKEQQAAVGQGRATLNGLGKKIAFEPDMKIQAMAKSLQPLVQEGDIVSPKTPEEHLSNIHNTQNAIADQGQQIREGLASSNAIWNSNELKGRLDSVQLPNVIKSESALTKQAENFRQGIVEIAANADKHAVGILDLRQQADDLINQDFGKSFFDTDKNSTAMRQYIYSVRDELNQFAADKLPDGKLPDGASYREALKNQSNLISAKDEMTQKFVRQFPEGSTAKSRFLQQHPLIHRALRSAPVRIGFGLAGLSVATTAIRKAITNAATGK